MKIKRLLYFFQTKYMLSTYILPKIVHSYIAEVYARFCFIPGRFAKLSFLSHINWRPEHKEKQYKWHYQHRFASSISKLSYIYKNVNEPVVINSYILSCIGTAIYNDFIDSFPSFDHIANFQLINSSS